jgi:hypothetical protein
MKHPEYTLTVETPADAVVVQQHEVDALRAVADRIADDHPPLAAEVRTVADRLQKLVVATRVVEYIELATRVRTVRIEGGTEDAALSALGLRYSEAPPAYGITFDVVDVDPDLLSSSIEVVR